MSAPYPPYNQSNPPYPPYPGQGGQPGYPQQMPPNPSQWGNPGFQQATPYSPNPPSVGFQMPSQPAGFNVPLPSAHGAYDPNPKPPYQDSNFGMGFDDKSIRQGFIRRVYSILSIQLLVTLFFVALFVFHEPTQRFSREHAGLMFIPLIGTFVILIVMACFESTRRTSPTNIILLGAFTFFESILVGFISSTYETKIVFMALGLTAAIVIGLTIFAFQTKYDFTMCGGALCIMVICLTVGSLIGSLFFRNELMHFILACFGAGIFSMYIVYDTQMMMGGEHKYSLSPEEYIFAALNLYLDIIQLFLYLLRILRYLNND